MSARESSPLVPGPYADPVASAWLLELGAVARRAERQTMRQSSSRLRLLGWSSRREGVRKRRRLIEQMLVSVETPTGRPGSRRGRTRVGGAPADAAAARPTRAWSPLCPPRPSRRSSTGSAFTPPVRRRRSAERSGPDSAGADDGAAVDRDRPRVRLCDDPDREAVAAGGDWSASGSVTVLRARVRERAAPREHRAAVAGALEGDEVEAGAVQPRWTLGGAERETWSGKTRASASTTAASCRRAAPAWRRAWSASGSAQASVRARGGTAGVRRLRCAPEAQPRVGSAPSRRAAAKAGGSSSACRRRRTGRTAAPALRRRRAGRGGRATTVGLQATAFSAEAYAAACDGSSSPVEPTVGEA